MKSYYVGSFCCCKKPKVKRIVVTITTDRSERGMPCIGRVIGKFTKKQCTKCGFEIADKPSSQMENIT